MKIWVTKYLFTAGIEVVEAAIDDGMASERTNDGYPRYFHGSEWHLSESSAKTKALDMIAKKRKTIAAQLKKLNELEKSLAKKR